MAHKNFASTWPNILGDIKTALNSQDINGIFSGLTILQAFMARFEYEIDRDREPLTFFFEETSTLIGNLVGLIVS
jgi:hypothetical protein